jgi:hypothetical protein
MLVFVAVSVTALILFLPALNRPGNPDKQDSQEIAAPSGQTRQEEPQKTPEQTPEEQAEEREKPGEETTAKQIPVPVKTRPEPAKTETLDPEANQRKMEQYAKDIRDAMDRKDFDNALELIAQARKVQDNPRLRQLESDLKDAVSRRARKAEELTHKPAPQVPVIDLLELHPDLRKQYNDRLQRIQLDIPRLGSGFGVKGFITVMFAIDNQGMVSARLTQDNLEITPKMRTRNVKALIMRKLNGVTVQAPKDKNNRPARLENWRVTFKVGKYRNIINLAKQ